MATSFGWIVNNRSKTLVFGFIHQQERNLCSLFFIPPIIAHLIIQFYVFPEYFIKCSNHLKISKDHMTISKYEGDTSWSNYSFGNLWIDSHCKYIAKWKIKIDKINTNSPFWANLFIAFITNEKDAQDWMKRTKRTKYLFRGNGFHLRMNKGDKHRMSGLQTKKFEENDILIFTLDTKSGNIYLQINGKRNECIFAAIERKYKLRYRLAVALYSVGNQITLMDFQQY